MERISLIEKIKDVARNYREVILYLIFGVLTTVVNAVVYFPVYGLCKAFMSKTIAYNIGTVVAWIVAVIFAYITNKIWVFESKSQKGGMLVKEFVSFTTARLLSLALMLAIMFVGNDVLFLHNTLVYLVGQVVVVVFNYVASKLFVFKNKGEKNGL